MGKSSLKWSLLAVSLGVAGCASTEVAYQPPMPTLPKTVSLPPRVVKQSPPETLPDLGPEDPIKATLAAARTGIVRPRKAWFKGYVYSPPYHPNHAFLVYIPEGGTSVFEFSAGEKPNDATCSDGGSILSLAASPMGEGDNRTWTWQVKAKITAPPQDCTVTTNRGIYSIVVQTTTKTHTSRIRWSDPYNFLSEPAEEAVELCQAMDINYRISGDEGAFGLRPGDISNDGSHTCIRFPQTEAFDQPAIWLIEGDSERPASPSLIDGAAMIDGVPRIIELRSANATLRIERSMP